MCFGGFLFRHRSSGIDKASTMFGQIRNFHQIVPRGVRILAEQHHNVRFGGAQKCAFPAINAAIYPHHFCTQCVSRQQQQSKSDKPELISNVNDELSSTAKKGEVSFATLFRNSPLVQIGIPEGKLVIGTIVDVVADDLYIDFGFKFNAVCRKPKQNFENYVRGAAVRVRINDLEISDRFLGSNQDMTLLEADVTLLGLASSPAKTAIKSDK